MIASTQCYRWVLDNLLSSYDRVYATGELMPGGLPTDAIKCVIRGHLQSTQTWSTGIWLSVTRDSGPLTAANLNSIAAALEPALATFATTMESFLGGEGQIDALSLYYYLEGELDATLVSDLAVGPFVGTVGGAIHSTRDALVTSFLTGFSGASMRGRSYFPLQACTLGSDQQVSAGNTGTISGAYATLLSTWNGLNLNADNLIEQVASVASHTKNLITPIVTCRTDSLVDTQRRREDKLSSLHTEAHAVT